MNETQQRPRQNVSALYPEPHFFVAPTLDERLEAVISPTKVQSTRGMKRDNKMTRYAAYVRVSSEDQVGGYSIEAQKRAIETWVTAQEGQLVRMYIDEAQSGRSADRPQFQQM